MPISGYKLIVAILWCVILMQTSNLGKKSYLIKIFQLLKNFYGSWKSYWTYYHGTMWYVLYCNVGCICSCIAHSGRSFPLLCPPLGPWSFVIYSPISILSFPMFCPPLGPWSFVIYSPISILSFTMFCPPLGPWSCAWHTALYPCWNGKCMSHRICGKSGSRCWEMLKRRPRKKKMWWRLAIVCLLSMTPWMFD